MQTKNNTEPENEIKDYTKLKPNEIIELSKTQPIDFQKYIEYNGSVRFGNMFDIYKEFFNYAKTNAKYFILNYGYSARLIKYMKNAKLFGLECKTNYSKKMIQYDLEFTLDNNHVVSDIENCDIEGNDRNIDIIRNALMIHDTHRGDGQYLSKDINIEEKLHMDKIAANFDGTIVFKIGSNFNYIDLMDSVKKLNLCAWYSHGLLEAWQLDENCVCMLANPDTSSG